jgi:acyl-CoA synthetase (AMP-forming)/AMP-acid ligase II
VITFASNVADVLRCPLRDRPDHEAVVTRSGSLSYRELDALANQAANALLDLGIEPGDRVAACLPNDVEIIGAFHGAMRIGAVWVGINEALAAPEKAYLLRDSGARLFLGAASTIAQLGEHKKQLPELDIIVSATSGEATSWQSLLAAQDGGASERPIDADAPAAIAYTSGTTGYPKGAVHSQRNLLLPGWYLSLTRGYDASLRKGDCFPLTILNMMVLTTLLTAQAGGCAVLMDGLRSDTVVDWIKREKVTVWNGPPPLLHTLAHDPLVRPTDLAPLVEVWSGGAACAPAIREAFEQKFGKRIFSTYGLTEAPTVVAIESRHRVHPPGMNGRALPHLDLTVRGPDGQSLPLGAEGELCVAPKASSAIRASLNDHWGVEVRDGQEVPTYSLMLGYWGRPGETQRVLTDGVLHTGDVGALDADGNVAVADRLNQIVNRGGANVYPAEVERVVLELQEVEACAVFGVPDERLGQRVAMLVQFTAGSEPALEPVLERCRAELAAYKVPEMVAAIERLPRNAMGKVDRRSLSSEANRLSRASTPK